MNLRRYLNESGKSPKELAGLLGKSEGTISDWLYARTYPRMYMIQKMSEIPHCEKLDLIEPYIPKDKSAKDWNKILAEDSNAERVIEKYIELSSYNRAFVETLIDSLRGK